MLKVIHLEWLLAALTTDLISSLASGTEDLGLRNKARPLGYCDVFYGR